MRSFLPQSRQECVTQYSRGGAEGGVEQRVLDLVQRGRRCFRECGTHPCWTDRSVVVHHGRHHLDLEGREVDVGFAPPRVVAAPQRLLTVLIGERQVMDAELGAAATVRPQGVPSRSCAAQRGNEAMEEWLRVPPRCPLA
jgi:hypothetical protein